jgi:hypothetical protein
MLHLYGVPVAAEDVAWIVDRLYRDLEDRLADGYRRRGERPAGLLGASTTNAHAATSTSTTTAA